VFALWATYLATSIVWSQEILQDEPRRYSLSEGQEPIEFWPPRPINEIDVDPRPPSEQIPPDASAEMVAKTSFSHWYNAAYPCVVKGWARPGIIYNPLYFEDAPLERNGETVFERPLVESARTAARFGTQLMVLPYNVAVAHPHACEAPPPVDACGRAQVGRPGILYQH
jgi:hypothetical protein